jgi:RimJ/RimL family protein N-acetyltransferase
MSGRVIERSYSSGRMGKTGRYQGGSMASTVRLRDVVEGDLPIFFAHQQEPDGVRMAAFPPRDADTFAAHWTKILADPALVKQTVLYDAQVAGYVVSWEKEGQRLVGYWIGREYWGKGIATQALRAFLNASMSRPLFAHVARQNIGSIRVLEKCGFTLVGANRSGTATSTEVVDELIYKLP